MFHHVERNCLRKLSALATVRLDLVRGSRQKLLANVSLAGWLLVSSASMAHAQSAPPIDQAAPSTSLGEVVVTAEKKSERLLDTPVPVTALDTAQLSDRNQDRLQDYFTQVPGLALSGEGNGQTVIILRGVTTADLTNPTVGILIDDVPFGSTTVKGYTSLVTPDLDPADLAQIEVLKGPQGTLYGASSLGGIVKYVTADPSTRSFSGRIAVDVNGTVDGGAGYGVRGGLNIPLSDTLALRVSGFTRDTPGYVDDVVDGRSDVNELTAQGGHVSLLWRPITPLSVKLGLLIQHTHSDGFDGVGTTYKQQYLFGDLKQSEPPGSGVSDSLVQLYSGTVSYHLGPVDLTYVAGYGIDDYQSNPNLPAYSSLATLVTATDTSPGVSGSVLLDKFETKKFTQELRGAYKLGDRLDVLVGGFYDHEATPAGQAISAVDARTGRQSAVVGTFNFPSTYEENAVFGNLTFHLTDKLDLQGGVRYSQNHQTYHEQDNLNPILSPDPAFYAVKQSDTSTTFQVTPSYKLSSTALIYARIASGYRPGGTNAAIPPNSGTPETYTADTTLNYEVGAKGSFLDRRLTYDVSFYDIEWSKVQVQLTDPVNDFIYFTNAGKARSTGAEFAVQYRPLDDTRLSINGSYDVAELTKDFPAGGGVGFAGSPLPFTPRVQGSALLDHDFPLPGAWLGTVGATVSYVGMRHEGFANDPAELRVQVPSYVTLDLRVTVHKDVWSANLFAKNVTNERGVLSSLSEESPVSTSTSTYDTVYIQPATIGLSVQRKF